LRRRKVFEVEEKRWGRGGSSNEKLELQKLSFFEKF